MMIMLMKSLGGTTEESKDKVAAARAFPNLEMRAGLRHALPTRPSCTHCVRPRHLQFFFFRKAANIIMLMVLF